MMHTETHPTMQTATASQTTMQHKQKHNTNRSTIQTEAQYKQKHNTNRSNNLF
ncbi:hypothetical protein [Methanimicrococcus hacksteinii]|uniref:hypothetical protein n=1 Tax=Methanimicrococcus hacksteinii TaxID=3028293 RepID=UPI00298EE3FD|nr:hypothetical protein [Methanimicrococcus sp. At1]